MSSEEFTYAFKPRLMGPAHEFSLSKHSLDWTIGPRSGRISYPMIRRIRLGYKPRDNSEAWAVEVLAREKQGDPVAEKYQGGVFCAVEEVPNPAPLPKRRRAAR